MTRHTPIEIFDHASPRPWSYHNNGQRDWIEDAVGNVVANALGHLDGPLIVACVNEAHVCGTETEALTEQAVREAATAD